MQRKWIAAYTLICVLLYFHDPGIKTGLGVFAYGQNLTVITDLEQRKM